MKLIAHRGNVNGSSPNEENTENYIRQAISENFDVEVDIRYIGNRLYLGHDKPDNEVSLDFLKEYKNKLWIHCKNIDALIKLGATGDFNLFCHNVDPVVLTSHGYLWTYPGCALTDKSIAVLPERVDFNIGLKVAGICSDYIGLYK